MRNRSDIPRSVITESIVHWSREVWCVALAVLGLIGILLQAGLNGCRSGGRAGFMGRSKVRHVLIVIQRQGSKLQ